MPQIHLSVQGQRVSVEAPASAAAALAAAGVSGAIAVRVNAGPPRDLATLVSDGDELSAVELASPAGREILRHSTAHVLAQAVTDLYPGARYVVGPAVEDGFYYDFEVDRPFTPEDLERIEARMREIVAAGQGFHRRAVTRAEALEIFAAQPYKREIIERVTAPAPGGSSSTASAQTPVTLPSAAPPATPAPRAVELDVDVDLAGEVDLAGGAGASLTVYDNDGGFTDLCRGPHLPTTAWIPAFTLRRSAAAHWRADERDPTLQRIYGTAWESAEALAAHLEMLAEAERRDHRRLGTELDLFSFPPEIGGGLAVWHPRGGIVRKVMEDYSRAAHEAAGYSFVVTPHLARSTLFETSGHLTWYAEGMYPPMEMEGSRYYVKPMNCPFHILVYRSRGRSYRELPIRLFEFGTVYRFERSGVLHGLTRARGFTQDDSHIFCTPAQLPGELTGLLDFVLRLLRDFGLTNFEAELATRPAKFVGEPGEWATAEAALRVALEASGVPYIVADGEGAFYAPKIDLHVRDAIGRRWQISTLQVDLQLPTRFELSFTDSDGSRQRPYMIHRALFGSIERFFGILLEHYAGALPVWLSPVQVVGIPIRESHVGYLQDVVAQLRAVGVRAEVDASHERMQRKIVRSRAEKVPYVVLAGDADVAAGAVSLRYRDGRERRGVPLPEVLAEIRAAIEARTDG